MNISAFGRDFPLPISGVDQSEFFKDLYREFGTNQTYTLELEDSKYHSFLIVYDFLLNPDAPLPKMKVEILESVIEVANYLDIPRLIAKLVELIVSDVYPRKKILATVIKFYYLPGFLSLAKDILYKKESIEVREVLRRETKKILVSRWKDLSRKAFKLLRSHLNQDLGGAYLLPLVFNLGSQEPFNNQTVLNIMPSGWAKTCQSGNRPQKIYNLQYITELVGSSKNFYPLTDQKGVLHYVDCPGNKEMGPGMCCMLPTTPSPPRIDRRYGDFKTIRLSNGWIAFAPPEFEGEFIVIWNPVILPDLQVILDESLLSIVVQ